MTRASTVSAAINKRAGKHVGRLVTVLQVHDGSVLVFTTNGARHQAAALSKARRVLASKGYSVSVRHGMALLPIGAHRYYLSVTGVAA